MQHTSPVARPKLDKTKDTPLNLRVYAELRDGLEAIARHESRSLNQMSDLLLRQAVIARLNELGETKLAKKIAALP
jgi:hypothetical protein